MAEMHKIALSPDMVARVTKRRGGSCTPSIGSIPRRRR